MKIKSLKKVLLSGAATLALAVSTVTSTFAFVILNDEAKISEFNFNIQNEEGLWVSLDGVYFSQDISYDMIKAALEKNINPIITDTNGDGLISDEEGFISLDEYTMNPVTMKANQTLVSLETYTDRLGQNSKKLSFAKDTLVDGTDPSGQNNIWYDHSSKDASSSDYLYFDLWFRIINNGEVAKYDYTTTTADEVAGPTTTTVQVPYNYQLSFSDYTSITGSDNSIELSNNLTTYDQTEGDNFGKIIQYGPKVEIEDDPTTDEVESGYRNVIKTNTADAMRLAVLNSYDYADWATAQETAAEKDTTTTGLHVFEVNKGLGSAAIANEDVTTASGDTKTYTAYELDEHSHDQNKNAMYTYYNNTHPISPFTSGASYNESFSTIDEYQNTVLGTFKYQESDENAIIATNYSTIKLSIAIYLEGWDADYLYGISANSLMVKLGFRIDQTYNPEKDPTKTPAGE